MNPFRIIFINITEKLDQKDEKRRNKKFATTKIIIKFTSAKRDEKYPF